MQRFISIIERSDPRLLALAAVLFSCVGFAIFQMVGSFGPHSDPAYRNQPAPAFAPPPSLQLVDPVYLTQQRLPDQDYETVYNMASPLLAQTAGLTVTLTTLESYGMAQSTAQATLQTLTAMRSELAGRTHIVTTPLTLTSSGGNAAEMAATVSYSQSPDGSPPVAAQVLLDFTADASDNWTLDNASLNIQGAVVAPSSSSAGS